MDTRDDVTLLGVLQKALGEQFVLTGDRIPAKARSDASHTAISCR